MKILFVSSWNERCGIAEYGNNFVHSLRGIEWAIVDRFSTADNLLRVAANPEFQVVVVNFEPGILWWVDESVVYRLRQMGKKTVLILHTSSEGDNRSSYTTAYHKVVVHEKTQDGFVHIPHGLNLVRLPEEEKTMKSYGQLAKLGSAGFPFNWKGFHQVAQAAELLGMGCKIFTPESRHIDYKPMEQCIKDSCSRAEVISEYRTELQVINGLQECAVNVFNYHGGNAGISGAVRLGLSAKRPMVISKCRQFRDIIEDYSDEVEIAEDLSPEALVTAIKKVLLNKKKPDRIIKDMNWSVIGGKYSDMLMSLV